MEFTLNLLDSVVLCDSALLSAYKTKGDLEFELLGLTRNYDEAYNEGLQVQADLQLAVSDLTSTNLSIENQPAGDYENALIQRRMKLELKIFQLQIKVQNLGVLSLIQRQQQIMRLEQEIALNDSLIALLNARKVELQNSSAA